MKSLVLIACMIFIITCSSCGKANQAAVGTETARVSEALQSLTHEGGEGNFLILHADRVRNYYVQVAGERDGDWLHAEAVSNAFLAESDRLTEAQMATLVSRGWHPPGAADSPHYSIAWGLENDDDFPALAEVLLAVLTDVYGWSPDRELEIEIHLE
jgi:hypothetical protein